MTAEKCKTKLQAEFLAFLNVYDPKTHLIKAVKSLD